MVLTWMGTFPRGSHAVAALIPAYRHHIAPLEAINFVHLLCRISTWDLFRAKYSPPRSGLLLARTNHTIVYLLHNNRKWAFLLSVGLCDGQQHYLILWSTVWSCFFGALRLWINKNVQKKNWIVPVKWFEFQSCRAIWSALGRLFAHDIWPSNRSWSSCIRSLTALYLDDKSDQSVIRLTFQLPNLSIAV